MKENVKWKYNYWKNEEKKKIEREKKGDQKSYSSSKENAQVWEWVK